MDSAGICNAALARHIVENGCSTARQFDSTRSGSHRAKMLDPFLVTVFERLTVQMQEWLEKREASANAKIKGLIYSMVVERSPDN
jgi:hypothetical protein